MVGMATNRVVLASALVTAGALVAGCGMTGGSPEPSSQPAGPSPLASLDPCNVVSPSDLARFGVTGPGEFVDQGVGEPGCDFEANDFLMTIYKAEKDGLAYWEARKSKFGTFEPNQVGSRKGIKAVSTGSQGTGMCSQIMESGGGSVSVAVNYDSDAKPNDEATCAKAMEIAQVVEPKLPK